MTYIVNENCIKCKFTDCVEVCPVDCFYEGENMLVIHPDECIDCGVCEPECPWEAIFEDEQVPVPQGNVDRVMLSGCKNLLNVFCWGGGATSTGSGVRLSFALWGVTGDDGGEVDVDDLPGPVGDGYLVVVVVGLVGLSPVLVPGGSAGDDVVHGVVADLAAGKRMFVFGLTEPGLLSVYFFRNAEQRLYVVADFMGHDVGLREVSRRSATSTDIGRLESWSSRWLSNGRICESLPSCSLIMAPPRQHRTTTSGYDR